MCLLDPLLCSNTRSVHVTFLQKYGVHFTFCFVSNPLKNAKFFISVIFHLYYVKIFLPHKLDSSNILDLVIRCCQIAVTRTSMKITETNSVRPQIECVIKCYWARSWRNL